MNEPVAVRRVVITFNAWEDRLRKGAAAHGYGDLELVFSEDKATILDRIGDAQVALVGLFDADMLRAGEALRWAHACSGGVNGLLFEELVASDLPLTCLKPVFSTVGAEHALAAMLGFARRLHFPAASTPLTQWDEGFDDPARPVDLAGGTAGIVGLGNMGRAIAARAHGLGMRVLGLARTHRAAPASVDALYTGAQRLVMLGQCHYVVIALPLTEATRRTVDNAFLGAMKPTAFLIDCSGRPAVFDYPALTRAIDDGTIAGVSLQPGGASADIGTPPPEDPFWRRPNVVVTPCRATSAQTDDKAVDLFFENLRRLEAGEPLLGVVDKEGGY